MTRVVGPSLPHHSDSNNNNNENDKGSINPTLILEGDFRKSPIHHYQLVFNFLLFTYNSVLPRLRQCHSVGTQDLGVRAQTEVSTENDHTPEPNE